MQHLEDVRDGGDLTLCVTPEVVLLNHGEPLQDLHQSPAGAVRPNVYPHSPIWHAGQEQLTVKSETWARQVLTPWQRAAAVTLVVKLPADTATDDHRTVIRDLTDARQRLDSGDCKGSIRASRDAIEVLRSMHAKYLNPKKALRTLDEREAAILDAEHKLIQALFDYESATHPDPGLREITWTREHALLALATATAVAQRLFSAPSPSTALPDVLPVQSNEHECPAPGCSAHKCRPMAASRIRRIHSNISAAFGFAINWGGPIGTPPITPARRG